MEIRKGHIIKKKSEMTGNTLIEYVEENQSDHVKIINLHSIGDGDINRGETFYVTRNIDQIYEDSNICPVCEKEFKVCLQEARKEN